MAGVPQHEEEDVFLLQPDQKRLPGGVLYICNAYVTVHYSFSSMESANVHGTIEKTCSLLNNFSIRIIPVVLKHHMVNISLQQSMPVTEVT